MTKIDPATYDETIRRPWHVPGVHERIDDPADDYEAALAPSSSIGFKLAGIALTAVILGAAAAVVFG